MPRPPKAREPLKQAALQLFVERGIHATGIREIAKHAGCSEAALYRHWANKDTLVHDLFAEFLVGVVSMLDEALASEGSPEDQLSRAIQAAYRLYDENPLVFRFVLLVQHELSKDLDKELRMPQDALIDYIEGLVKDGHCSGNPALISAALIGIILQTAQYVIYERLPGPLSKYTDDVIALAKKMVLN